MREALAAFVTLVGLLARVQPRVLDQVVFVFERFLTDLTLVWSLSWGREQDDRVVSGLAWSLFPRPLPACPDSGTSMSAYGWKMDTLRSDPSRLGGSTFIS